ncbi:MAG: DUF481 domain-containing protein, partial [Ignavibacteriae bacterium]|nr:DUF481 domain-containing protein [Ignavibacteriota bacterium]
LVFLSVKIFAQVNTEKYRTSEKLDGLAGYLEISGTFKRGNTEKTEGNLDGRVDWKLNGLTTFFVFESNHEWVNTKRISNEGLLHIRNVTELYNDLKSEIFGQINYDKKILIDNRELLGAGLRYKILKFENSDVNLGTSYMFEHENYNLPENATHLSDVNVHRWSNYLSLYVKLNSTATLGGVIYYQPMFDDFSDHRILSENSLTVGITELISISVNFRIRHDSDPPDGIKKTDTKTNFGLAIKF